MFIGICNLLTQYKYINNKFKFKYIYLSGYSQS